MKLFVVLSVCVQLFLSANCALAPFITPCREKDSACLKTSAQKVVPVLAAGVPELELNPLDPMVVNMVKASQAGLDMEFRNTVVKGLRNCEVLNLKRNGKKLGLELKCSVTLIGNYTLGGQLLVMPIEGKGKYRIRIRDIIVKIQFEVQNTDINGETHWTMTTWRHTADVKTNVNFNFQNLFNGNKQLSDVIHEFANTSWRDIFQEVAPPIVKAIVSAVVEEVKKLFVKVPIKEMVLD